MSDKKNQEPNKEERKKHNILRGKKDKKKRKKGRGQEKTEMRGERKCQYSVSETYSITSVGVTRQLK
jgi:hypothetical protein